MFLGLERKRTRESESSRGKKKKKTSGRGTFRFDVPGDVILNVQNKNSRDRSDTVRKC